VSADIVITPKELAAALGFVGTILTAVWRVGFRFGEQDKDLATMKDELARQSGELRWQSKTLNDLSKHWGSIPPPRPPRDRALTIPELEADTLPCPPPEPHGRDPRRRR
jgi:hypothetical protein